MWEVGASIRQGEVHGIVTAVEGCTVYYWLENGTCGGCLEHRLEEGYRMARQRKNATEKKAEAAAKETNTLLDAVKFCAPGFNENGETYATHAMIYGGYISTYNGIVMFGHKIDTTLTALPHYGLLLKALRTTDGGATQITQLDPKRLQIKQPGFRTIIPCLEDFGLVTRTAPDNPVGLLDSRMREGFETLKQIANKRGETVMQSSVLIGNGYMVATDNIMLGYYWHGLGFPELAVPADFVDAVLKVPKPLVSFGFTPGQSVTFYFDDGSFIRSQLYSEQYPDWTRAMPEHFEGLQQLPDTFFSALEKIEPFIPNDRSYIYMSEHLFHTHADPEHGTAVDCSGLLDSPVALDAERLLKLKGAITHIDTTDKRKCRFVGENFKGVLATFVLDDKAAAEPPAHGYADQNGAVAAGFAAHVEQQDEAVQAAEWQPPEPGGPVEYEDVQEPAQEQPAAGGFHTYGGN